MEPWLLQPQLASTGRVRGLYVTNPLWGANGSGNDIGSRRVTHHSGGQRAPQFLEKFGMVRTFLLTGVALTVEDVEVRKVDACLSCVRTGA